MTDTVTTIRQAIQDFVAPEIKEIKGDIKALDAKIEGLLDEHATAEIHGFRDSLRRTSMGLRSELHSFRGEILGAIQNATLRGDLETTRQLADIRERVTRLEERQARQQ